MTEQLKRVCRAFRIEGEWASYEEISVGNINHTYKYSERRTAQKLYRPEGQHMPPPADRAAVQNK